VTLRINVTVAEDEIPHLQYLNADGVGLCSNSRRGTNPTRFWISSGQLKSFTEKLQLRCKAKLQASNAFTKAVRQPHPGGLRNQSLSARSRKRQGWRPGFAGSLGPRNDDDLFGA